MHVPSRPSQIRRMPDSRLKRVAADKPVLAASLALVHKRCGQPSCGCHRGGPAHPAYHLTYKEGGKTRTVYVPQDLVTEVQSWVDEHQRLKSLLGEISQLTLALVRNHVQDRRRRRGRP
jgi:hypothetical protein